jgi:hypothetical protein
VLTAGLYLIWFGPDTDMIKLYKKLRINEFTK